MYQYLPCDRKAIKHTGTVPLVLHTHRCTHIQMYQYLPCDRDTVKHTGTVPLVLHTDRCTSTYPVIEMYTVKHTGTVPLVLYTQMYRCTSTLYPVPVPTLIETQSNTQVQYLWCYTHTDRCTSTYPVIER